ncbi:hypothetical protein IT414_00895 [bacterium]|nr:hypothetical protein [bacterium]
MFGWFFISLSILLGWSLVRQFDMTLRRLEALAMSVAVGMSLSAWIVFIAALGLGFSLGLPLAICLIAVLAFGGQLIPGRYRWETRPYSKKWRWLLAITALGTAYVVVQLIVLSYQFPNAQGAWVSNGNAWGDGPLHVAYVNQFAQGNTVDMVSPSYMKVPLTYPVIADFYSAVLKRLGGDWSFVLMVPSAAMVLALMYLAFSFGYRILKSARAAWLQYLFFVFSGSLQGAVKFTDVLIKKGVQGYHDFVGVSVALAAGDNYLNFIHSHPIPQRAYLFGMPLFITIATVLLEKYRHNKSKSISLPSVLAQLRQVDVILVGLLIGMMPLVHIHSFLVLVGLLVLAMGILAIRREPIPVPWIASLGTGLVLAAPQLAWQFSNSYNSRFTKWIAGWTLKGFGHDPNINFVGFWLGTLGFLFVVMVFGGLWLKDKKASMEIWLLYIAGLAIFAICNVYVFQPNIWDNMKFFEYGFWFIMMVAAYILAYWWRRPLFRPVVAGVSATLVLMGFYTLVLSGPKLSFELLSQTEVAFGEQMQQSLPKDAFILVGDRHNHPITMLAGRKVLMTYGGWYNLYDDKWETVWADRTTMLRGGPQAKNLIEKYSLTHAVISDAEVANGEASLTFFEQNYSELPSVRGWHVYDLRQPL